MMSILDASRVSARRPTFFLCFAKERRQRKASPTSGPAARVPCADRCAGETQKLAALRFAQTSSSLIPAPLRCSALPQWALDANATSTRHGVHLWSSGFGLPRRYEEVSSAEPGGSGLALSERSEFSQTPPGSSNAAYRRSRATNPARLSFAYFSLAKQRKVRRPPGRDPACRSGKTKEVQ
jgi:hypothetical protein